MRKKSFYYHKPICGSSTKDDSDRERRLELLIERFPKRMQKAVRWLRRPSRLFARVTLGLLLLMGGVFSVLPILGLWMLPLGLVLLSDDVQFLRNMTGRILEWVEHRRPHWMGLPHGPQNPAQFRKEVS